MKKIRIKQKESLPSIIPEERIVGNIYYIRGRKVMFDKDLAGLYEVETKALNRTVKRNIERFPEDFMFQLSKGESDMFLGFRNRKFENTENLRCQIVVPQVMAVGVISRMFLQNRVLQCFQAF